MTPHKALNQLSKLALALFGFSVLFAVTSQAQPTTIGSLVCATPEPTVCPPAVTQVVVNGTPITCPPQTLVIEQTCAVCLSNPLQPTTTPSPNSCTEIELQYLSTDETANNTTIIFINGQPITFDLLEIDENTLLIDGKGPPNEVITLLIENNRSDIVNGAIILNTLTNSRGDWSLEINKLLANGDYSIYAVGKVDNSSELSKKLLAQIRLSTPEDIADSGEKIVKDYIYFWWWLIITAICAILAYWLGKKRGGMANSHNQA